MNTIAIRSTLILALIFLQVGCAVSKYQNRTLPDATGAPTKYFFAYGKFCGPNYPDTNTGKTLQDYWPPVDDVDALCYAHDQCYALNGDNDYTCDNALLKAAIDSQTKIKKEGCWNLITDLTIAFFGKNYSVARDSAGTISAQLTHSTLGMSFAAFWAVAKAPIRPFLSEPAEGACIAEESGNPERIIARFEELFITAGLNKNGQKIVIPIPIKP